MHNRISIISNFTYTLSFFN